MSFPPPKDGLPWRKDRGEKPKHQITFMERKSHLSMANTHWAEGEWR